MTPKRLLFTLGLTAALLMGCNEPDDPTPTPTPTPQPTPNVTISSASGLTVGTDGNAAAEVSADGTTLSVSFNASLDWTASSGASWCNVSPASGSAGNVSVSLVIAKNETTDSRKTAVTLKCGTVSKTVSIDQAAPDAMLVSPSTIEADPAGGDYEIEVQYNVKYTYSIPEADRSWISVTGTKALQKDRVQIAVAANHGASAREGSIIFNSNAGTLTVKVTQEADHSFSISPTKVELGANGGFFEVEVFTTQTYHLTDKPEWVTEQSVENQVHTFIVGANSSLEGRSGVLVFCDDTGICLPCTVTQAGKEASLTLWKENLEFGLQGGSTGVEISSNVCWTATSDQTWCTVTPAEGEGDGTLTIQVSEFKQQGIRKATVTVSGEGGVSKTLTVEQEGIVPFSVSPTQVNLGMDGGTFEVQVKSSYGYHVSSQPDWVTEITENAANKVHKFQVGAAPTSESRSGVVVFCDDEGVCLPVNVKQEGNPDAIDWSRAFHHRSLFMRFTATWCGYCPNMADMVKMAQAQHPGKIEALNLHAYGSTLYFSPIEKWASQFDVTGYPSGVFDGRKKVPNYGPEYGAEFIGQLLEESEQKYPVKSAVGFNSSLNGQNLSIDLKLFIREAGNYKVTVLVTESGIVAEQSDYERGTQSNYIHDNVARVAITDITGVAFTVTSGNSIKKLSYSVTIPSSYQKDNLKILVIVWKAFGQQPKIVDEGSSYGDYYIDNCASGKAGASLAPALSGDATGGNEDIQNGNPVNW